MGQGSKWDKDFKKWGEKEEVNRHLRDKDKPIITLSRTLSHNLSHSNYLYISTLYYNRTNRT